jgi:hypothetical protein
MARSKTRKRPARGNLSDLIAQAKALGGTKSNPVHLGGPGPKPHPKAQLAGAAGENFTMECWITEYEED